MEEPQPQSNVPVDGAAWVDLLVKEMMSATSVDDAKSRAGRVLESLEKSISTQASAEVAEGFHKVRNQLISSHSHSDVKGTFVVRLTRMDLGHYDSCQ